MVFVLLVLAALLVTVVPYCVNRAIDKRFRNQMEGWKVWSKDHQGDYVVEFIRHQYESQATAWRIGLIVGSVSIVFLGAQQWLIYNTAHDSKEIAAAQAELATENCRLSRTFLQDEAGDATRDIRRLTNERDVLTRAIIDTPAEVTEIPGYEGSPIWFRRFLDDLLQQQIVQADDQVHQYDTEIDLARIRRDEIQALLDSQDCPRQ